MGRMITVPIRHVTMPTSDADFDILQLTANSSYRLALHMLSLSSNVGSDTFLDLAIVRRSTTGTGTAITEVTDDQGNARTPSVTAVHSIAAPGTLSSTHLCWQWSMRNELLYIPTPECREIITENGTISLHCATSIGNTIQISGFVKLEEF
jgi:hypothetical protein